MAADDQSIHGAPRLGYAGEPHGPAYEMWREEFCRRVMAADLSPLSDGSFHCDVKALMLPQATISSCSGTPIRFMTLNASDNLALLMAPDSPLRPRFLRWMSYIAAQIYALYWIRDDLSRLAADEAHEAVIKERTTARIAFCWEMMEAQVAPAGRFMLGDEISVLDLCLAVESRWGPRRKGFYAVAPKLGEVVRRVDADPRLADFWPTRMPFMENWEG